MLAWLHREHHDLASESNALFLQIKYLKLDGNFVTLAL